KGMAGVPRASLVVIAATLATFNIPEAGLLLIMGIDQFLDMGRSATNVIGNSIATAVVAKWEGELGAGEAAPRSRRGAAAAAAGAPPCRARFLRFCSPASCSPRRSRARSSPAR